MQSETANARHAASALLDIPPRSLWRTWTSRAIVEKPTADQQVWSQAEIETTVADAVMNYLRSQKEVVKVVPDGVSLEVSERLPPKALITVHTPVAGTAAPTCSVPMTRS